MRKPLAALLVFLVLLFSAGVLLPASGLLRTGTGKRAAVPTARGYSVRTLDRVVAELRRRAGLEAGPLLDDAAFLRRVYLDLIGRPPTVGEWRRFMAERGQSKRSRVVRELVGSPEFGRRWARFWRDVILYRVIDPDDHVEPAVLEEWLAEELNAGKPWTEIVQQLITARGRCDLDGPANFVLAHMARPTTLAAETARVFLGLNIACAECHDDPSGRWKREEFHGFAAFFARVDERRLDRDPPPDLPPDVAPPTPPFEIVVLDALGKEYAMPDKDDPDKSHPIKRPRLLNGHRLPAGLPDAQRRGLLAQWLTHRKNFWFARAYVNRIWFEFFGSCFSAGPDDIGPGRPLRANRILYGLASAWNRASFSARWVPYVIARSDVYQRRCVDPEHELAFLVGVPRKRLTSYQVRRSLETIFEVRPQAMPSELIEQIERAFGVDPSDSRSVLAPTVDEVLLLLNSPDLERWIEERARALLYTAPGGSGSLEALCRELYVRVLSRLPTEGELEEAVAYLADAPDLGGAVADLLWCLINSDEFLYVP